MYGVGVFSFFYGTNIGWDKHWLLVSITKLIYTILYQYYSEIYKKKIVLT